MGFVRGVAIVSAFLISTLMLGTTARESAIFGSKGKDTVNSCTVA